MQTVTWTSSGLSLSRLAFGCASVMGKVGRRKSLDAMAAAFDVGVTHFDVARAYGFGEAESVVGEFARGRRSSITIATKFGIRPSTLSRTAQLMKPIVRAVRDRVPGMRRIVKRASGQMLKKGFYSLPEARTSIETSLRQLKTETIDILFIHECSRDDVLDNEVLEFLEALVRSGKIRAWGIATEKSEADFLLDRLALRPDVIQHEYVPTREQSPEPAILHSPFALAARLYDASGKINPEMQGWAKAVGLDVQRADLWLPGLLLEAISTGMPECVFLCSMFTEKHIRENARHLQSPSYKLETLTAFHDLLYTCYRPPNARVAESRAA